MDVAGFCSQAHVLVVAGKGGVGKTTVSAALGVVAARAGLDVLLVALDDSATLPSLFGADSLGYEDTPLGDPGLTGPGAIRARVLTSDAALLEYLVDHGLRRVAKRLVANGAIDVIATAIPGIREVLVLGKLKQLELARAADLIIVDAPATGHAMTFLTSTSGLVDAARGGPLRSQAEAVVELLGDPERCNVILVTIPEETPVNELVDAAYRLEDEVGIQLGPVVINACFPADPALAAPLPAGANGLLDDAARALLESTATFAVSRHGIESEQIGRLETELALPKLRLPLLFNTEIGPSELGELAAALEAGIESL